MSALHRHADCNADVWMSAVVHVVPIVRIDNINVISLIPVVGPTIRPRINHTEPIASVLKARKPANNHIRLAVDDKRVAGAKVAMVVVLWDAVAVVATALLPIAVL